MLVKIVYAKAFSISATEQIEEKCLLLIIFLEIACVCQDVCCKLYMYIINILCLIFIQKLF